MASMVCATTLSACATPPSAHTERALFDPKQVVVFSDMKDQYPMQTDFARCEDQVRRHNAQRLGTQVYVYRACLVKHNYRLVN